MQGREAEGVFKAEDPTWSSPSSASVQARGESSSSSAGSTACSRSEAHLLFGAIGTGSTTREQATSGMAATTQLGRRQGRDMVLHVWQVEDSPSTAPSVTAPQTSVRPPQLSRALRVACAAAPPALRC